MGSMGSMGSSSSSMSNLLPTRRRNVSPSMALSSNLLIEPRIACCLCSSFGECRVVEDDPEKTHTAVLR